MAIETKALLDYWAELDEENRAIVSAAQVLWDQNSPRLVVSDEQKQTLEENRRIMGSILEIVSAVEASNGKGSRSSDTQDS